MPSVFSKAETTTQIRFHPIPYVVHTHLFSFISLHITQPPSKKKGSVTEELISIHLKTTNIPLLPQDSCQRRYKVQHVQKSK